MGLRIDAGCADVVEGVLCRKAVARSGRRTAVSAQRRARAEADIDRRIVAWIAGRGWPPRAARSQAVLVAGSPARAATTSAVLEMVPINPSEAMLAWWASAVPAEQASSTITTW